MPPETITFVERNGSFALVTISIVWIGAWVVPRVLQAFRDLATLFREELMCERESHEKQHQECEEVHRKTAEILAGLTTQVERLADCTEEHRPHSPKKS